jgi:HEPN domain-containing protein
MSDRSESRLAAHWLGLAQAEFAGAVTLLSDEALEPRLSVGLATQAAEKALKAALASIGVTPPRSHDLVDLARRCVVVVRLTGTELDLRRLADAHAHARYPDADETPYDLDEATELVGVARSVIDDVAAALNSSR